MHLFFIQTIPDIDVIVPIIHQLSINKSSDALVICTNPRYDIKNDYQLQYLINKCKVEVLHLHQINSFTKLIFGLIFILSRLFSADLKVKLDAKLIKSLINFKFFTSYLKKLQLSSITIDESIPNHVKGITNLAFELNIKIVIVPVGVQVLKVHPIHPDSELFFDYKINVPLKTLHPSEANQKNIIKMSCIRFCREWQKINFKLLNDAFRIESLPSHKNKLKVLVFSLPDKNFNFLEGNSLVEKLRNDNNLLVIFKDKPRVFKGGKYDNYPSAFLIQWADVVISPISSIVMDIFYYKKMFIYLKYLSPSHVAFFEKYDVCWEADNEDEVQSLLNKMHSMDDFNAPKTLEIESVYDKMVYVNDGHKKNALTEYSLFYKNIV